MVASSVSVGMARSHWLLMGLSALLLLIAWSFRDNIVVWLGPQRSLPSQPMLSSESRRGDWTMWRGNAQRTGVQPQPRVQPPAGRLAWQFTAGAGFISSPVAFDDSLFIGDTEGRLYRLHRRDGSIIWQLGGLGPIDSSPATAGDLLYIGLRDGRLLAIRISDGHIRWEVETANPIFSSPLVHAGVLYVGSGDGFLYALDAASGAIRWRAQTRGWVTSSAALLDDLLYVGSNDGSLYFIDRYTGVRRWHYRTQKAIVADPAVADGKVLFGGEDRCFGPLMRSKWARAGRISSGGYTLHYSSGEWRTHSLRSPVSGGISVPMHPSLLLRQSRMNWCISLQGAACSQRSICIPARPGGPFGQRPRFTPLR